MSHRLWKLFDDSPLLWFEIFCWDCQSLTLKGWAACFSFSAMSLELWESISNPDNWRQMGKRRRASNYAKDLREAILIWVGVNQYLSKVNTNFHHMSTSIATKCLCRFIFSVVKFQFMSNQSLMISNNVHSLKWLHGEIYFRLDFIVRQIERELPNIYQDP